MAREKERGGGVRGDGPGQQLLNSGRQHGWLPWRYHRPTPYEQREAGEGAVRKEGEEGGNETERARRRGGGKSERERPDRRVQHREGQRDIDCRCRESAIERSTKRCLGDDGRAT